MATEPGLGPATADKAKRGTRLERALAYGGIALWIIWGLLSVVPPPSYIAAGICAVAVVLGIREMTQWQARKQYSTTPARRGKHVYPSWAWFGVGAVPATTVVEIIDVVRSGPGADLPEGVYVPGLIAWVVGGVAAERFLVTRARRRDNLEAQVTASTASAQHGGGGSQEGAVGLGPGMEALVAPEITRPAVSPDAVVMYLREHPGAKPSEIAKALACDQWDVTHELFSMKKEGLAHAETGGRWTLT